MAAAFGSGGALLHAIDEAGVLREVSVDPERTVAVVCARAGRSLTGAEWQEYLPGLPYREICPRTTSPGAPRTQR
ncbi:hypothetical protein [Nonomuraea jabiensis]|uniref:hypothetical protein n=1 Tax=Nonomuraea jabiensis TaxID=882448 RepID=UPI0036AA7CDC